MFYSSSEGMYDGRQLELIRADRPRPVAVTLSPNLVRVSKSSDSQITHAHVVWCPWNGGLFQGLYKHELTFAAERLINVQSLFSLCCCLLVSFPTTGTQKIFAEPELISFLHGEWARVSGSLARAPSSMPPLSSQNILFMLLQQWWWRCSVIYLFACLLSSHETGSTLWQETYPRMNNSCHLLDIQYELGMVLRLWAYFIFFMVVLLGRYYYLHFADGKIWS